MNDVISQYQKWKQQGESLRGQAKEAMESRFRELLLEAVQVAEEYRADFGISLKPASPVTTFRYRVASKGKGKKAGKKPGATPPEPRQERQAEAPDPKLGRLQKKLATARKKLEATKAAGKPTRALEDNIYEIEDELRLATHPGA